MTFATTHVDQLANAATVLRLSLHVLAAAFWVGGQFVLGGLMPTIRGLGEDASRTIAKAFGRLSWPAFWVLIATGVWNYAAMGGTQSSSWRLAFSVKMVFVFVAGLAAFMHTRAKVASQRGMYAGLSALASVVALVLGVALAG
ncbi:MAG: hypothetical protein B7X07_05920 [Actinobacteria bacterium 21-64-8]|nr:MAG: hypothetical protein B7X07_05920 [Actinobacteria bacterium 21-64-8]